MPRRSRLELPGIAMHITQRGVNRGAVFIDDEDRFHYLDLLGDAIATFDIALHAYVLMGNHVHLLTSSTERGLTSAAMKRIGQNYVPYFNRRHRRTGTLWEGRFKSCLVDDDGYLMTVYRYIELNPVRAAMVACAEDYIWSSARANLGLIDGSLLTPHDAFIRFGVDAESRAESYARWLADGISDDQLIDIRRHVVQERAYGSRRFQAMAERSLNRPVAFRPPGRAPRTSGN
jgi:putative transposase